MSKYIQPVRGTHDLLHDDILRHRHVEDTAFELAGRYGFSEIATPIIESEAVFKRTLGDATDVVNKEMYEFEDRGGDTLVLRPENTASVMRAVLSNGLQDRISKFFYRGPMFRRERPQKGRYRQFHQIGVESIGLDGSYADVEVIALGRDVLEALGVGGKVRLLVNTMGDGPSREKYNAALHEYFSRHESELSDESRERLKKNPRRILDSKDAKDQKIAADAPGIDEYLSDDSRDYFENTLKGLKTLGVEYQIEPRLVRGLDYYCHTTFEFVTDELGAQGAVMAGGRYNGLTAQLGGPSRAGVGWAAGVERLAMLLAETPAKRPLVGVISDGAGAEQTQDALKLADRLRRAGFNVELAARKKFDANMKMLKAGGAACAVIIDKDQFARGAVKLRDMQTGESSEVELDRLEDALAQYR